MKKMSKVLMLCMVFVLVLSMAACGAPATSTEASNEPSAETTAPAEETQGAEVSQAGAKDPADIKVAGIVYLEDQFMKLLSKGYQDAADAAGVECSTSNVNNDQSKETQLINTYVEQGLDGISIAPLNEESSITTLKDAASKGMKITLTDSTLSNADFIVGGYTSDQGQLGSSTGKIAKKFIEEKLGGKAKIAVVQFKSLLPEKSAARVDGFLGELEGMDGVEVIADQDAWVQDKAVTVANDILTAHPDVDIIFAANDGGTVGATMAVKNAGKAGEVFVFGIDASEQIAAMLQEDDNILQAVTGQDAYSMGYKSMEMLIQNIMGTADATGDILTVDGILLDRADQAGIETFLTNLKERTGN
ncbi:substrate-binding domain-containing protein [Christensenella intestinihominis]|uniref:substrate-binding domain-containing protein n=1 Tax=Christensenella intestinihominis TaxID=1851429 RepID=UPI00082E6BEE|nr:substrate-binding domain-containing protein [Christensenella intestinihominis]